MLGIYGTVYNSADTVRQTIEDLKSKLKEDFILVVTDNFSTDGTYEILKEYDFVDIIRMKCTRGWGRQKALEHLIKNYKEVDFIFYIDFDVTFRDFTQRMLDSIKKRYQEGEIYWIIASYDTYKDLLRKVAWPNSNVGEDFIWDIKILENKFKLYFFAFNFMVNQVRFRRKRKYARNFKKRLKRIFKHYITFYGYNTIYIFKSYFKTKKLFLDIPTHTEILFPEELGVPKQYLFLATRGIGTIPAHIKQKVLQFKDRIKIKVIKSKSKLLKYKVFYRDVNSVAQDMLVFLSGIIS